MNNEPVAWRIKDKDGKWLYYDEPLVGTEPLYTHPISKRKYADEWWQGVNELADKLLGSLTMEYDCDKYMKQAATMLRQQAKELDEAGHMIGVLREYISDLENGLDSSIKLNKAQAERDK